MANKLSGSCLCGGITFDVTSPELMGTCHCTRCQRWGGGAGSTVLVVGASSFQLTKGKDLVKTYKEQGFGDRSFCGTCGSHLYGGGGDKFYVHAGLVKDHGMKPQFHIQVAYKAPWDRIPDDEVQFPEWPPNMG